ncbi:MAG: U32 family peptidase [Bacilli bacterium]|nr:U32 family peptidase [Bacilli bacterium]
MDKRLELLAPAGDLEKLKVAVLYGADAVFIGGKKLSLRAKASNFTVEMIKEACDFAHAHGSKVYITVNILPHEEDMVEVEEYLMALDEAGIDAIIVSSMAIVSIAKKINVSYELHLSTQQSTVNLEAINFYKDLGFKRVVLGRETTLEEIELIKTNTDMPLEVFIHGGMCSSYSGRCSLSNHMTRRDANRGGCAHSCRWNYRLFENENSLEIDGHMFKIGSKDLMSFSVMPKLIDLGIDSFKIEGRMKSLHYIATIVKAYREFIDGYLNGEDVDKLIDKATNEAKKAENRDSSVGFFNGQVTHEGGLYFDGAEIPPQDFIGIIKGYDQNKKMAKLEQRNYFKLPLEFELIQPKGETKVFVLDKVYDDEGNEIVEAKHAMQTIYLPIDEVKEYSILRKKSL